LSTWRKLEQQTTKHHKQFSRRRYDFRFLEALDKPTFQRRQQLELDSFLDATRNEQKQDSTPERKIEETSPEAKSTSKNKKHIWYLVNFQIGLQKRVKDNTFKRSIRMTLQPRSDRFQSNFCCKKRRISENTSWQATKHHTFEASSIATVQNRRICKRQLLLLDLIKRKRRKRKRSTKSHIFHLGRTSWARWKLRACHMNNVLARQEKARSHNWQSSDRQIPILQLRTTRFSKTRTSNGVNDIVNAFVPLLKTTEPWITLRQRNGNRKFFSASPPALAALTIAPQLKVVMSPLQTEISVEFTRASTAKCNSWREVPFALTKKASLVASSSAARGRLLLM
jgi:hypothetical protein